MAFDHDARLRMPAQPVGVGLQHRHGVRADVILVIIEVNVAHILLERGANVLLDRFGLG